MVCFVRIGFGQEPNPNVKPGQGKGDACQCGEKGINISTGFDNATNTSFQVGQAENQWKIVSGPNGVEIPKGSNGWGINNNNSTVISPSNLKIGNYLYEYKFTVPIGKIGIIKLKRIAADDAVVANLDNNPNPAGFFKAGDIAAWYTKPDLINCIVLNNISAGPHSLIFNVENRMSNTGLLVEGCMELISSVPECRCPAGWLSNTSNKDGDITTDGRCKKVICDQLNIKPAPKNGTQVEGNLGFIWDNRLLWYGTKENGGAPICTLNGKVIDWNTYKDTQGRGE